MPKHSEETPPSPKMEPTLSFPSVKPVPAGTKRKNPVSVTSSEGPTSKKARSPIEGSSGSTFTTPRSTMSPDVKEALVGHLLRVACCAVDKEKLAGELGITKKQLDNAICSGRVNLRSKLIKAAGDL